jgi:hypothetical protein
MAEATTPKTLTEIRVRDPLSDVTRKERKALLAASLIGLFIAKTGLLPTEVSALGVKFDFSDQKAILGVLALVTAYFLVGFALYAASDFLAWRWAFRLTQRELRERKMRMSEDEASREREIEMRASSQLGFSNLVLFARPISAFRAAFEFLLPVVFATYAVAVLLTTEPPTRPAAKTPKPSFETTAPGVPVSAPQLNR